MKEIDFKKIITPFKEIFNNPVVTKTQAGIQGFVDGVKNLFHQDNEKPGDANTDINNYLKSPDEIEAELRFTCAKQNDYPPFSGDFSKSDFLVLPSQPTNIKSLEEALAGEMEENY